MDRNKDRAADHDGPRLDCTFEAARGGRQGPRGAAIRATIWGNAMTYRICYDRSGMVRAAPEFGLRRARTEEFATEHEALGRARQLLEAGDRHAVSVEDGAGNVLHGVRLHLRLGFTGE